MIGREIPFPFVCQTAKSGVGHGHFPNPFFVRRFGNGRRTRSASQTGVNMKNAMELFENIVTDSASDIPYRDDLEGMVFIADSEQEATARFDAWMNEQRGKGVRLVGVFDHMFGTNICAITVVYWQSQ